MAIPTIEGSGGLAAVQAQQAAVKKTEAGAETQTAIAPKKAAAGASRGAGAPPAGGAGKPAAAAGATTSESTSYNKKDTNKDGVVSAIEELTYDLKHPTAQTGSAVDVKA
jgi:hypothetical protein